MSDVTETDAPGTDALDAVVDSALERALLDEADSRRYFALAGAVVRAHGNTHADSRETQSDPLTAALVCTVAVSALESASPEPTWSPPDARNELVAAGAVRASQRFNVAVERVATRAGLPLSDLRTRLSKESRGDQL
ncbi:hypothetical protein GL213_07295 [Halogeometricum borinquense]|uniref:Uncharacterized protein n=1 Tax=Halogeometricum borinquense TaxID=60847 RepID=A0A6C0UGP2_9EURY|nr:hypothetical protein [Halogeometricum borinquense]QIB74704.1 hypothetical protein G3I44_10665 [Halogeometricum borinquense]QIQ76341.1 hypothetical protein GL213_07295 [Halogeometricum borinquense]